MGVVYCIINRINNKKYIGIDKTNFDRRWKEHIRRGKNSPILLIDKKIKEYDIHNFSYKVLCNSDNYEELKEKERYFIGEYNTYVTKEGYNLTLGGDDNPMFNDIVREKHRKIMKERNSGINHYMYGRKQSKEVNEKRSESMKIVRANTVNPFTLLYVRKRLSDVAKQRLGSKNPNFRYDIGKEELYKYYIKENHTLKGTISHFKCSETTIVRKLRKYNIRKPKLVIDKSILCDLRFNKHLTVEQCAEYFKCSTYPIKIRLRLV